jgi:hypothetical protein
MNEWTHGHDWSFLYQRRNLVGIKTLVKLVTENFEKFNSSTGWANITGGLWSDAMQALSHFSCHKSGEQHLLCNIQGDVYKDG